MAKPDLIVLGAGGHAKVAIATARASGHKVVAAFDDTPASDQVLGVPIVAPLARAAEYKAAAIIAIGNNAVRARVADAFALQWTAVIHPQAVVDPTVEVGPGSVIFAGAVVQVDARIGAHAILNTSSSVDHDCEIGDFTHIGPGAHLCGNVAIGSGTLVGVGASARPGTKVGEWAIIGAGAAIVGELAGHQTYVGVPARPRRS